ncbi:MAG: PAS domain S-box protein [Gammaproteobacteria bacterium]|nr:MAG: PAS domain S-box protein [Gammaproteobacteria bacterium]
MAENNSMPPHRFNIVLIGIFVGISFYVADIIIDVFVFRSGTLIKEILDPTNHEIWMRTSVLLLAVVFSIYIQILIKRIQKIGERAETAEKFLNSIVDNIPNMIFIKDANNLRFIRVNHCGEKLLGLMSKDLVGKNDYDFFPESQAEFFTRKDREVLKTGVELDIPEEVIDTATMGRRWLHTKKVPVLDDNGKAIYLLGISEDITENRQAEIDLKKTEIRFHTLFDAAADFIFVIDPDGIILEANRYACERSGYEKNAIIGQNIKIFFTKESQDTCDCNFPVLRERGYSLADIEFVCKDGRILQLECMATGVPDESGTFKTFLLVQRDVTDKKKAEEEILRQQREMAHVMRLSTMGEMASGMAHELNQPLTALVSYCATAMQLARGIPSLPEGYLEILERASEQAQRAGSVIRHLREFIKKDSHNKTQLVLDDLIQSVIEFISWEIKDSGIRLTFLGGANEREAYVGKVQIEQILINLIRNSIEAIRQEGIADGRVDIASRLTEDGMIEVSVADNGPGIDPSVSSKLFEPYQTTKEAGMGLGLSISRSIIESHNGKLWNDQQRQPGALFYMSIPACD